MYKISVTIKRIFSLSILCLLCACGDLSLTHQDNLFLQSVREYTLTKENALPSILSRLVKENPVQLAEEAAKKRDFKLISLAMGYHATEKNAFIFGVKCSTPVETQSIVFGCVPPPPVIFKLVKRYNISLMQQQNFPEKENCKMDAESDKTIEAMEKEMEISIKRHTEETIKNWEEKTKKSKIYND